MKRILSKNEIVKSELRRTVRTTLKGSRVSLPTLSHLILNYGMNIFIITSISEQRK